MEQKAYEITGTTRLGGLLGSPVSHSLSPQMHNASFRKLGIDAVYLCFDVGPEKRRGGGERAAGHECVWL